MLQNNPNIKSKINDLWNKFWSGGISNPLTAIEQITYLLFMKKLDENELANEQQAEFLETEYTSIFEGEFHLPNSSTILNKQDLRWSVFKRKPSDEMLIHVQQFVFPFIKQLDTKTSPFSRHMKNAVFIIQKPSLLKEAIGVIDEIFEEMEKDANENGQDFQDIQGDVYEMLLSEIASAGKNGQFRTPRHIIKLLVELVNPQLGHRIVDPACGTGGFLLGAYQYLVTQIEKNKNPERFKTIEADEDGFIRASRTASLTEEVKKQLGQSIQGFDIDGTMVRLGLMNLMMHGIDSPQIEYTDTLSKSYEETSEYNIVLANPPFTGNIDKGDINEALELKTTKTELLFIERIYKMLKIGGTAGVIVPQGVLFGTGNAFKEARKLMIEKSELKAVITAPSGVFKPYAGVSTALLIFTKGNETENIWFYDMEADGYTLDDKRNKLDNYGDLQDIITQYQNRNAKIEQDRKSKFFFVPKSEVVKENYDLSYSRYKTILFEKYEYESPKVILEKLTKIDNRIGNKLAELKKLF